MPLTVRDVATSRRNPVVNPVQAITANVRAGAEVSEVRGLIKQKETARTPTEE